MYVFKKVAVIFFLMSAFFISAEENKDFLITKIEYAYGKNSISIGIEFKNNSESILLFPGSMRNQIKKVYETGNTIVINECTLDFKNTEDMVDFQNKKISLDDEILTDELSSLYICPVLPGDNFVYNGFVDFSEMKKSRNPIDKIKIILKYGKSNDCLLDYELVLTASGELCSEEIEIAFAELPPVESVSVPIGIAWPVWDIDAFGDFSIPEGKTFIPTGSFYE